MSDLQLVGPKFGGTGTGSPFTADITGAQRVTDAHAHYYEAVRNGGVFSLRAANMTNVAGQGYAQAAGATSNFVFWNPLNSGKLAVLLKFIFASISGTAVAGDIDYQLGTSSAITVASNGVHVNTLTGSSSGSVMRSRINTTAAAMTGSSLFTDIRPAFIQVGTAVLSSPVPYTDNIDGEIILQPGMAFTYGTPGAGTTWIVSAGLTWEEIPLLS